MNKQDRKKRIDESRLYLREGYNLQRLYAWQFVPGDRVYLVNAVHPVEVVEVWTDYEEMKFVVGFAGGNGLLGDIHNWNHSDYVVDRNEELLALRAEAAVAALDEEGNHE
jgi:hypothetical protein